MELTQTKQKKETRILKIPTSSGIHIIRVSEKEREKKGIKTYLKKKMAENFPNLRKETDSRSRNSRQLQIR